MLQRFVSFFSALLCRSQTEKKNRGSFFFLKPWNKLIRKKQLIFSSVDANPLRFISLSTFLFSFLFVNLSQKAALQSDPCHLLCLISYAECMYKIALYEASGGVHMSQTKLDFENETVQVCHFPDFEKIFYLLFSNFSHPRLQTFSIFGDLKMPEKTPNPTIYMLGELFFFFEKHQISLSQFSLQFHYIGFWKSVKSSRWQRRHI